MVGAANIDGKAGGELLQRRVRTGRVTSSYPWFHAPIPKDMLDLASHIVKTKAGHFEPSKFEDQYEDALKELLKKKQEGKPIERPERPKPTNVVNLMDALRQSVEASGASTASKPKADAPARRTAHEKTEQPKRKKARRTG
jgi:DNA end-binding protein Ku